MNSAAVLWMVLVLWPVIGLVLAMVLGRRGHDPFGWLVLGMLLGPLALALALDSIKHDETRQVDVIAAPPDHANGQLDILVGFDGSDASHAALRCVEHLFGEHVDRLTLATVLPFDGGRDEVRSARSQLLDEAARTTDRAVGLELLSGHPGTALQDATQREGYDLLVVGTAEPGRLLGSAAKELAAATTVPVLLVPDP